MRISKRTFPKRSMACFVCLRKARSSYRSLKLQCPALRCSALRVQYIRRRDIQRQSAVGNEKDYTVVHNIRIELGDGRTARLGLAEK